MKKKNKEIPVNRIRTSYVTSIVSVSLVLFTLGIMCFLLLNTHKLSNYIKETIGLNIVINDNVKEVRVLQLQKELSASDFVRKIKYVSKEDAAKELKEDLGRDFIEFLGYNPLLASLEVRLFADYANTDSINLIKNSLLDYPEIKEIYYQESLIDVINQNIKKISIFLLGFGLLLFIIAFTLINNTVRLSVYAKRFTIKTMQLVGATRTFIRRPFLWRSVVHGFYASIVAIAMIIGILYIVQQEFVNLIDYEIVQMMLMLCAIEIAMGIILNCVATFFAVNRYLRVKVDKLYM